MASSVVRSSFRALAASAVSGVPYVDFIAQHVDPATLPSKWISLEFDDSTERRIENGPSHAYEEVGRTYFVAAALSGDGDGDVFALAEQLCALLYTYRDATIDLHVTGVEIVSSIAQDSDGRWFILPVAAEWQRRFYVS